ncbi:hypothetical protein BUALT_Bualt08G0114400 [Buddleja alternifolia]|uniref:Tetratricopeptide repeat protein 33 n=1 Tax=Buddleja alternifolia TaxID=168488 RepID=A0AAV6X6R0_9LAMI|nr:hypothetical protein BUALT_Bualt08G0114400 [Buddleja alternifolia]
MNIKDLVLHIADEAECGRLDLVFPVADEAESLWITSVKDLVLHASNEGESLWMMRLGFKKLSKTEYKSLHVSKNPIRNLQQKMKMTWKKNLSDSKSKNRKRPISINPNLPFEDLDSTTDNTAAEQLKEGESVRNDDVCDKKTSISDEEDEKRKNLAQDFEARGNKLAEEGKYREALGKWESAITLVPERAVLHEQKAQILLELGEAWSALKAAARATELEPKWAEAWITLGRAQLNFGEPDSAIESFDKALAIKPDSMEAKDDRQTASHLVKRRKQLHSTGLSSDENRFLVGDQG